MRKIKKQRPNPSSPARIVLICLFLCVETALYLAFLFLDMVPLLKIPLPLSGLPSSDTLKYASILCCAAMALFLFLWRLSACPTAKRNAAGETAAERKEASAPILTRGLLATALCFTALSDRFLLFSDDVTPGLYSFCVVQTLYLALLILLSSDAAARMSQIDRRPDGRNRFLSAFLPRLCVRAALAAAAAALLAFAVRERLSFTLPLAFYALSFADNLVLAFRSLRRLSPTGGAADLSAGPRSTDQTAERTAAPLRRLAFGLLLFALCDVNVLCYNLSAYVSLPNALAAFFSDWSGLCMWLFYLPAQVILVLSLPISGSSSVSPSVRR